MLIEPPNSPKEKSDRSEADQGQASGWDRFVTEWQSFWSDVEDVVEGGMSLIAAVGRYILLCAALIQKLYRLLRKHSGRWVAAAAAVGLTSPLSGGWGMSRLSDLPLGKWAPAVFLPAAVMALRAMLRAVAGESRRRAKRREGERSDSALERGLAVNASRRQVAAEQVTAGKLDGSLDDKEFVHDILAATYISAVGSHCEDFILTLLALRGGRLQPVATRGRIDDALKGAIQIPWSVLVSLENAFENALESLQYRSAPVGFAAGEHHYVLLGLSGATIPEKTVLEVSKGATKLMSQLAYGDEAPGWMADER